MRSTLTRSCGIWCFSTLTFSPKSTHSCEVWSCDVFSGGQSLEPAARLHKTRPTYNRRLCLEAREPQGVYWRQQLLQRPQKKGTLSPEASVARSRERWTQSKLWWTEGDGHGKEAVKFSWIQMNWRISVEIIISINMFLFRSVKCEYKQQQIKMSKSNELY